MPDWIRILWNVLEEVVEGVFGVFSGGGGGRGEGAGALEKRSGGAEGGGRGCREVKAPRAKQGDEERHYGGLSKGGGGGRCLHTHVTSNSFSPNQTNSKAPRYLLST